ncbi:hypothetical protein BVX95_00680 [archaeon D22]|nr:hypothetical protein BVX95_00680 [archaeon D22]
MNKEILIFGTSYMGEEYLKLFKDLNYQGTIIGRDEKKATSIGDKYAFKGMGGGIDSIKELNPSNFDLVVIASAIESLKDIAIECLKKGFNKVLIEKPGALNTKELTEIKKHKKDNQEIWIAYNRRYFASTLKIREIMEKETTQACFFDFTDREKDIILTDKSILVKNNWGFANSSHVIDMAFFLIGLPSKIESMRSGSMTQHPLGTTFVGHGSTKLCLFSYFATWSGGGRWNVEISTEKGRYKLSPLEELHFCEKNQFSWSKIKLNNQDDIDFKPGLKKMVESVLKEGDILLPTLEDQIKLGDVANQIFGYN